MSRFAALALAVVGFASLGVDAAAAPGFTPADGRYKGEYTSGPRPASVGRSAGS